LEGAQRSLALVAVEMATLGLDHGYLVVKKLLFGGEHGRKLRPALNILRLTFVAGIDLFGPTRRRRRHGE